MIRTDGKSWPPGKIAKRAYKQWGRLRERLVKNVEVRDGDQVYRFRCSTYTELVRAMSLLVKEKGTIDWIRNEVGVGDVFYDIGANVGIYTILAAKQVGATGAVFSFEPHSANFTRLLDNILVNDLQNVVTPCNIALHEKDGVFSFNYLTCDAGTSNSQLDSTRGAYEDDFQPSIAELKSAAAVDNLLETGALRSPQHIKIDVDGNELQILKGMQRLLKGEKRPLSIQIEINKRDQPEIEPFMRACGYGLAYKHFTRSGLKRIERGGNEEAYLYNAVFKPDAASGSAQSD